MSEENNRKLIWPYMSNRLVHLTRSNSKAEAHENFVSIINTGLLNGSAKDILGGEKVICFSETPISMLSNVLAQIGSKDKDKDMRYAPFGVSVAKDWIFDKGGRPVIYQTEKESTYLPNDLLWRHATYQPQIDIDFSWEREWRIKLDVLRLNKEFVIFIVSTRKWADYFYNRHNSSQQAVNMVMEETGAMLMKKAPWNFLVLSDLGYHIGWPSPQALGLT